MPKFISTCPFFTRHPVMLLQTCFRMLMCKHTCTNQLLLLYPHAPRSLLKAASTRASDRTDGRTDGQVNSLSSTVRPTDLYYTLIHNELRERTFQTKPESAIPGVRRSHLPLCPVPEFNTPQQQHLFEERLRLVRDSAVRGELWRWWRRQPQDVGV